MGFETQEEAESWAENMEFLADQRKEEKLLASTSEATLDAIRKCLHAGQITSWDALCAAHKLGKIDGGLEAAKEAQRIVEGALKPGGR